MKSGLPAKRLLPGASPALEKSCRRRMPPVWEQVLAAFPGVFPTSVLRNWGLAGRGRGLAAGVNAPARLYVERPGKCLRPIITAVVLEGLGRDPRDYPGVLGAIELMEAATVSFDDIIDGSDTRRGGPATHKLYGETKAYLAYQAAYNWAYRAFLAPALKIEDWRRLEILSSLSREIFAYGYGQASELFWTAARRRPTSEQYLDMSWDRIRFLSFNGPFRIGALLGGASRKDLPLFEEAGSWLGMAYHLHGDELNLFPRSADWGKPLADDITAGRYTYLYLKAMELAPPSGRRELAAALGGPGISARRLKNVIDIVRTSGALRENRRRIGVFYAEAQKNIAALPLAAGQKKLLSGLALYMAYDREK